MGNSSLTGINSLNASNWGGVGPALFYGSSQTTPAGNRLKGSNAMGYLSP